MTTVMTAFDYIQQVINYIRKSCYEYQELPELDYPNLCNVVTEESTNNCNISLLESNCKITIKEI